MFRRSAKRSTKVRQLGLEALEGRQLMATDFSIPSAAAGNGPVNHYGTIVDRMVKREQINGAEEMAVGGFDGDGAVDLFFCDIESGDSRTLFFMVAQEKKNDGPSDESFVWPPFGWLPPGVAPQR